MGMGLCFMEGMVRGEHGELLNNGTWDYKARAFLQGRASHAQRTNPRNRTAKFYYLTKCHNMI